MTHRIKQAVFFIGCMLAVMAGSVSLFAQNNQGPPPRQIVLPPQLMPPHPPAKMEQRLNIDAKRQIESMDGEDALPRSREFKRTDSTYYVGWMFEGVYK